MAAVTSRKHVLTAVAALVLMLTPAFYALAQQAGDAKKSSASTTIGKRHTLAATLATGQWGCLAPKKTPNLTAESGEHRPAVETMMHSHDKVRPGITMDEIVALRRANPGGGPHSMTGPIYVNGAEPGDVMEIRIVKIVPKSFGINFNLPGKDFPTIGALAPE